MLILIIIKPLVIRKSLSNRHKEASQKIKRYKWEEKLRVKNHFAIPNNYNKIQFKYHR